jgi:hypothetical protein
MLMSTLPKMIVRLASQEPVYALFLWYHDSSSTDVTPQFGLGTRSVSQQCELEYADSVESRNVCVWAPQQWLSNPSRRSFDIGQSEVGTKLQTNCQAAYSLMLAANKSDLPLPDEGEILMPFRMMMRRCAVRMNDIDWSNDLDLDDGFVVVALNYTGYWLNDDLQACIPPQKVSLFKQRDWLPY